MPATDYLETLGQPVPEGTKGEMQFKLAKVDDKGVATITIEGLFRYLEPQTRVVVTQTGTWTFDTNKGRDLKMESTMQIDMSGKADGKAKLKLVRTVDWK